MPTKLSACRIQQSLARVPLWKRKAGAIHRTFEFQDFVAAIRFVNQVARLAEQAGHHPDIDVRWNRVQLTCSTHDAGGLTTRDFAFAQKCDRLPGVRL